MFFLSLLLFDQSVTLDADPHAAAVTCARAARSGGVPGPSLRAAAITDYYMVQAALTDPEGGGLLGGMPRIGALLANGTRMPLATAVDYLPVCDARFPNARRAGPIDLPPPGFERDAICTLGLSLMGGSAERHAELTGERKPLDAYVVALRRYTPRVRSALTANGFSDEASLLRATPAWMAKWLGAANPDVLSQACIAALPA